MDVMPDRCDVVCLRHAREGAAQREREAS